MQLTPEVKTILAKTLVAAGITDITDATVIDTSGFEGVRFTFHFGAIVAGAVTSVGAAGKATNNPVVGTDDLLGTGIAVADTDDDTLVILDIHKPLQQFIRPFVRRATANATLNGIVAELYGPVRTAPTAQDASVSGQELHVSPAVGTS